MEDIGLNRDRWYCEKALADKDDCEEYEIDIHKFVEENYIPVDDKPGYETNRQNN